MNPIIPFSKAVETKLPDAVVNTAGETRQPGFPDCVFPGEFGQVVRQIAREKQNIPSDYLKASIFSAVHSAIGASLRTEEGDEKPISWMVLVGRSGDAKTHALHIAYSPFNAIAKRYQEEYKQACRMYDAEEISEKPFLRSPKHNKATIEALNDEQVENPKGTTLVSDELKSWIDNFGRSNRGNDEGFYLDSWNGTPFSEATRHGKKTFCENPYLSIAGGTQPGVVEDLLSKSKMNNGFFQRCLFVVNGAKRKPRQPQSPTWDATAGKYSDYIVDLYDHEWEIDRVPLSADAKEFWADWCVSNNNRFNEFQEEGDHLLASVVSKWEIYLLRWALSIQALKSFISKQPLVEIDLAAMESAVRVHDFFFSNTVAVKNMIDTPYDLRDLSGWQLQLWDALEDKTSYTKATAVLREQHPDWTDTQIRGRISRFLSKRNLFRRAQKNEYEKLV